MRAAGQTEQVGLSPATVNRHITQLSTIAKYCRAKQRRIGQVELLSDFRLIDPKRDGEKRPAFEVDEVETLLAHPVWTSTASEPEMLRIARRQQIFAAVYWLPLLSYYSCALVQAGLSRTRRHRCGAGHAQDPADTPAASQECGVSPDAADPS